MSATIVSISEADWLYSTKYGIEIHQMTSCELLMTVEHRLDEEKWEGSEVEMTS